MVFLRNIDPVVGIARGAGSMFRTSRFTPLAAESGVTDRAAGKARCRLNIDAGTPG